MLSTKFQVKWRFGSGEEAKNRFSRWPPWRPSWISDRNDLKHFDLQVTPMLLSKFQVNWLLCSGDEAKNRFSRISDWKEFSYFDLQVTQMLPTKFQSVGVLVQEKKRKIDFQDGRHSGHLRFPIRRILAVFDLQVTLMLPTKFRVNWPRGVGGVGFKSKSLWPHDAGRTTDIVQSQ